MQEPEIERYLEDRGIEYKSAGSKDVGKGWLGIPCPKCGDHAFHMGISIKSGACHCWLCGEDGNMVHLVHLLEPCSYEKARVICEKYGLNSFGLGRQGTNATDGEIGTKATYQGRVLPLEVEDNLPSMHVRYLEARGFDPAKIISQYSVKAVYNIGKYRGRLIIPHYLGRRLVTFVARDVTGISDYDDDKPKYLNCPEEQSIVPVNKTIYNIDKVKQDAILVEGVTDVWRIGDGAIASCTANITPAQKQLLIQRLKGRRLFVMYDSEAMAVAKARKVCYELGPFMQTELIKLDQGDPADMQPDEVRALRRDLLGD